MVLSGEHRRNWGKLHIGQSPEGDILVAALTDSGVSDPAMLDQFLDAGIRLTRSLPMAPVTIWIVIPPCLHRASRR